MIEKKILDALNEALPTGIKCYTEIPKNHGDVFLILEKIGSNVVNRVSSANFTVRTYAPSLYDVAALNDSVARTLRGLVEKSDFSRVEVTNDFNNTDTAKKEYRYQLMLYVVYVDFSL